MAAVRVGIFAPVRPFAGDAGQRSTTLARIADAGIDHVCVRDHVSFFVGAGADALINATSLLTHYSELPCYVAPYMLPLRHPVPVARELASIAELAPRPADARCRDRRRG
jgi:alkanesulfonate monooxygenase SsuD/methylene tetrahydromethanopterin reductase-like flavin-dependent oxidoreductase (luciferase family)